MTDSKGDFKKPKEWTPFGTTHNNMGFFSEIRTALNEIFAEFSQDVQFRGKTYKCIIGENGQHEVELESGGFVANETFTATPPFFYGAKMKK